MGKKFDWDEWVELAVFNYNTSVHEGTKHTPYELVYGKIARSINVSINGWRSTAYIRWLYDKASNAATWDPKNSKKQFNSVRSKEYYDRKTNPKNVVVADYVFLQKGPKPKKLGDHWSGPHRILEVFPNENVRIEIGNSTQVVHSNRIRHSRIVPTWIYQIAPACKVVKILIWLG